MIASATYARTRTMRAVRQRVGGTPLTDVSATGQGINPRPEPSTVGASAGTRSPRGIPPRLLTRCRIVSTDSLEGRPQDGNVETYPGGPPPGRCGPYVR